MNSLLRVPAKESRALGALKQLIPAGSVVHSFLLFDNTLEMGLAQDERFVVAHTNKYVVYEFWKCVQENPHRVADIVEYFQPIEDENIFHLLQENWPKYRDPYIRSGLFLLLNRYSNDGNISHGSYNPEAYRPTHVFNLRRTAMNNTHLILDHGDNFLNDIKEINTRCDYVFLPIFSYSLNLLQEGKATGYEETIVYHKQVEDWLRSTDRNAVLLYRNTPSVRYLYKEHQMYFVDKYGRLSKDEKNAPEVLIANF